MALPFFYGNPGQENYALGAGGNQCSQCGCPEGGGGEGTCSLAGYSPVGSPPNVTYVPSNLDAGLQAPCYYILE